MEAIIFMFCLTLHNIEEALWLTGWQSRNMPDFRRKPQKEHFIFAVLGITALGYLTAGLYSFYPDNIYFRYAFTGFTGAMLLNVVIPHLILSIIYRKYCPGIFTGFFLILPFHIIILSDVRLSIIEIIISTIVTGLILIGFILIFEYIAKKALDKSAV